MRVLKLVEGSWLRVEGEDQSRLTSAARSGWRYVVEIWQPRTVGRSWFGLGRQQAKVEWVLVESRVSLRLGKPLPLIPFVFHGAFHSGFSRLYRTALAAKRYMSPR